MPAIVSGIAMPTRRHDVAQPRQLTGRSNLRPAPISAMMTTNSVKRSVRYRFSRGLTHVTGENGVHTSRNPIPMHTIGSESGKRVKKPREPCGENHHRAKHCQEEEVSFHVPYASAARECRKIHLLLNSSHMLAAESTELSLRRKENAGRAVAG